MMSTHGPSGASRAVARLTTLFARGPGLALDCGRRLGPITVAWEQYGALNRDRSNAILVCHALSGGAHAAGRREGTERTGWWDAFIGPGQAFDTSRYCVICSNVLGSCYGTTGPASIDPVTGRAYGPDFPAVTVWDMVRVQRALIDRLGIQSLAAVAGGSMGGMQALAWPVAFPEMVRSVVAIATTDRHSPMQIAFNEVARRAVMADPAWCGGRYEAGASPAAGLAVARMLGHVTYLSEARMERKFGRRAVGQAPFAIGDAGFEVERYLEHQGRSFVQRFDANALLYLTKALDAFDLRAHHDSIGAAMARTRAAFLLLSFSSDWLYPPAQLERVATELTAAGLDVEHACLASTDGHDAFLLDHEQQAPIIRRFLRRVGGEGRDRRTGRRANATRGAKRTADREPGTLEEQPTAT